jgi:hypothetical protein
VVNCGRAGAYRSRRADNIAATVTATLLIYLTAEAWSACPPLRSASLVARAEMRAGRSGEKEVGGWGHRNMVRIFRSRRYMGQLPIYGMYRSDIWCVDEN